MTYVTRTGRRGMFMAFRRWPTVAAVVLAAATAPTAEAQVAGSFEQLGTLVGLDDRITVTDRGGQETTGRIAFLSPSKLTLLIQGSPYDFDEADIDAIRHRHRDSPKNGAVIGLLSGIAAGCLTVGIAAKGRAVHPAIWMTFSGLFGGVGVMVGAGVDAVIQEQRIIYRPTGSARRLTVSPLLSRGRRGVAVSLGF